MNMIKGKKPDYLVLVNEDHRLPDAFEETVEIIDVENVLGNQYKIEKKTYAAFLRLQKDILENDGIQIELTSVYRTLERQEEIFEKSLRKHGLEHTRKYVAKPGHSEHHTGLAIDVGIMQEGKLLHKVADLLSVDHLFKSVHEKLSQYGFILRYPEGKESVTKIAYEPWHLRYLDSSEIAKTISDQGICFEEYWEKT